MYLNEQIPMVCLGCLENKYFPRDLINPVGWFSTKPSGTTCALNMENIQLVIHHVVYAALLLKK
jgi:hypothetical protein